MYEAREMRQAEWANLRKTTRGCGTSLDLYFCKTLSLIIFVLCLFLHTNTLFGGFVFDDHEAIETNNDVIFDTPLTQLFKNDFWGTPISDPESHKSYRPLTILSFRLNRQFHGLSPLGFHLVNVFLHASVCVLLLHVFIQAGIEQDIAGMAAMIFTVHPIHTEAVANVVGRGEILSALFYLLSFLAYLKYLSFSLTLYQIQQSNHLGRLSMLWLPISMTLATIALLCKEQGITVLGVCLLYDLFIVGRIQLQIQTKMPWIAIRCEGQLMAFLWRIFVVTLYVGVIILGRVLISQGSPMFVESDNPASFSDVFLTRTLTYLYLIAFNVWLLLCPSHLCFDWSMGSIPLVESLTDWRNFETIVCFIILITLGIKSILPDIYNYKTTKSDSNHIKMNSKMTSQLWSQHSKVGGEAITLSLGAFLIIIPFIPATNLLFPVGFVVAERVLYLPSMGFCLLVAMGIKKIGRRSRMTKNMKRVIVPDITKPVLTGFYLLLIVFSLKTVIRNSEWKDTESLALSALYSNPNNAKIHFTLGNVLAQQGKRRCEQYYREAIKLRPNYTLAWTNLGLVLFNTERPIEAEECYKKALSIKHDHVNANTNMAHLCRLQKRWKDALKHYRIASQRRPTNPFHHYHIGMMLLKIGGHNKEAEQKLTTALELHPNYGEAHIVLGQLLASNSLSDGHVPDVFRSKAIYHLRKGLSLVEANKKSKEIYYLLGKLLAIDEHQLEEAKFYLERALQLSPGHDKAHQELAQVREKLLMKTKQADHL